MKRTLLSLAAAAALAAGTVVTPILFADLPRAVQQAVQRSKRPSGAAVAYVKLVRDGAPFYEMKVQAGDGRDQEILYRPDGTIAETEEAVPIASVPAAVRTAIEAAARGARLIKVDRIERDGRTLYEGEILDNGVKKKPIFDAAGTRVE